MNFAVPNRLWTSLNIPCLADICHMFVVCHGTKAEIHQLCHPKMQSSHNPKSQSFRRFLAQELWIQKAPEAEWNCLNAGDSK